MSKETSSTKLGRRLFLTALGLGLSLPLAKRMARLALAQGGDRPVRLLMIFVPHGFPVEHFEPLTAGGAFDLSASGIGCFAPFEPYQSQLTFLRRMSMREGVTNHMAIRGALTGAPDGQGVDSLDYLLSQQLGFVPHVLGAQPYKKSEGWGLNSYLNKHGGAWVRALESPSEARDELFKDIAPSSGFDESALEKEVLALTEQQVSRLYEQVRGLTAEENKLEIHLEALQNMQQGSTNTIVNCSSVPELPAVNALAGLDPLDESLFGKVLDAHLEVAAHAMVCGAARIVTLQALWATSNTRFDFPDGPGVAMEHHATLSHMGIPRDAYANVQRWFCERISEKLLQTLDQPDPADPAHTVLDNSIVYLTTEVSDGQSHTSHASDQYIAGQKLYTYLPQIVIGGGGGRLKPAGLVQVEENRPHTDLLATIAAAMGVHLTEMAGAPVNVIEELTV